MDFDITDGFGTTGIRDAAGELYFVPVDPMDLLQCDSCQ